MTKAGSKSVRSASQNTRTSPVATYSAFQRASPFPVPGPHSGSTDEAATTTAPAAAATAAVASVDPSSIDHDLVDHVVALDQLLDDGGDDGADRRLLVPCRQADRNPESRHPGVGSWGTRGMFPPHL